MITIEQLLESVDLDFEPRFVTKDKNEAIYIWADKPEIDKNIWDASLEIRTTDFGNLKLAEFEGKDWKYCIYEVPQKTTGGIKKIEVYGTLTDYKFEPSGKFEPMCFMELINKINELVDAVNELKGA